MLNDRNDANTDAFMTRTASEVCDSPVVCATQNCRRLRGDGLRTLPFRKTRAVATGSRARLLHHVPFA